MKRITLRRPEGRTFSALFTGDVCAQPQEVKDYLPLHSDSVTEYMKEYFASADLRFMQWESAVTESGSAIVKSGPPLKTPPGCLNIGKALNIDVMLLANNHVGDYGSQGVLDTLENIHAAGFKTAGAGKNLDDAEKILYLECSGLRMAVVNFCENEFGIAMEDKPGVAPMNLFRNIRKIREARKNADTVIVAIHGGHEHYTYPSPRMVEWYHQFAEAGADAVWNCHTHCPAGVEVYKGIPVIYSPGNFYFPHTNKAPNNLWYTGYLTKFHFDAKGVYAFEIQPYTYTAEKITPMDGEEEEKFFAFLDKISAVIADPEKLRKYFDAWCSHSGVAHIQALSWAASLPWTPGVKDDNAFRNWMFVRNLFCCESHNDLVRRTARLLEEGTLEDAAKLYPEIAF